MEDDKADPEADLTCIHWGYLNVMHLCDGDGKKMKRLSWQTFWADLCGSTLRLYQDTSLPKTSDFPPSTMIGPKPEDQIKHAFFCLKTGSVKDFDYEYQKKIDRKHKVSNLTRKNMLQIILPDNSVYFLQAPTTSALYRWRTKLQSSIDKANGSEKHYEKLLNDAKIAIFQRQRCLLPMQPTYPSKSAPIDKEADVTAASTPSSTDPRIAKLKEKLLKKECLLKQLNQQEKDFLGVDENLIMRIEFLATAKTDYFLVPGCPATLIPAGQTFTVYGQLPNGRWRCSVDRQGHEGATKEDPCVYPLIGSVPTSVVTELSQPDNVQKLVGNISISSDDTISDISLSDFLPAASLPSSTPSLISLPTSQNQDAIPKLTPVPSSPSRPTQLMPGETLNSVFRRIPLSSESSASPTSPLPQTPVHTLESAMTDLNQALESLNQLRPRVQSAMSTCSNNSSSSVDQSRPRVPSAVSTCSNNSSSSQEEDDMCRGSRLELVSDDVLPYPDIVRRTKRDIRITRKLHAKGISLIVGSSSSSEDEEEIEEARNESTHEQKPSTPRKIEELHVSKEKLTENKASKAFKPTDISPKAQTTDRGILIDKPTINNDLLREFSNNSCYGLPVRNSVTQTQFKPLASHEIPPPLHQRRTLQMTRKEKEGFGFVLQTYSVVQAGAFSDSMTFVSNVSEDGPAYLAGMRPGDVILEVENGTVEDYDQKMIVGCLKGAGASVRLVVVFKDAIRLMKLATRLTALKARLNEAEMAYEALETKEKMFRDHVKDPSILDKNVKVASVYIHIQTASSTFARDSPLVKNTVVQNKHSPTELLQSKQTPVSDMSRMCGQPTMGYDIVREFASSCETNNLERSPSPSSGKFGSDTSLNNKPSKSKKQTQRSSFVSYVEFELEHEQDNLRRRIKSEGNEPEGGRQSPERLFPTPPPASTEMQLPSPAGLLSTPPPATKLQQPSPERSIALPTTAVQQPSPARLLSPASPSTTTVQVSPRRTALTVSPAAITRPDSYMFAVGTNSIDALPFKTTIVNTTRTMPSSRQ